jgi:hypothetical protein
MTDEIDEAQYNSLKESEFLLTQAREEAAKIPVGYPGNCVECGEHSLRLVKGVCAPCRDN